MIFLPQRSQIFVATLLGLGLSGCLSVMPMQTASVVQKGAYRVGGATTISQYCSLTLDPAQGCNAMPQNSLPLPEVRLGARHGVAQGLDLGVSLQGQLALNRGYQLGLMLDAKKEVWSRSLGGDRRQLLSVGPGLGYTSVQVTNRNDLPAIAVADLALPVYFGHQTDSLEWVAAAKYVERLIFSDQDRDGRREMLADGDLVLSVGFYGRGPAKFGLELAYQTGVARPMGGLWNLSAGVTFDLGLPKEDGS